MPKLNQTTPISAEANPATGNRKADPFCLTCQCVHRDGWDQDILCEATHIRKAFTVQSWSKCGTEASKHLESSSFSLGWCG